MATSGAPRNHFRTDRPRRTATSGKRTVSGSSERMQPQSTLTMPCPNRSIHSSRYRNNRPCRRPCSHAIPGSRTTMPQDTRRPHPRSENIPSTSWNARRPSLHPHKWFFPPCHTPANQKKQTLRTKSPDRAWFPAFGGNLPTFLQGQGPQPPAPMISSRNRLILSRFAARLENCFSHISLKRASALRWINS